MPHESPKPPPPSPDATWEEFNHGLPNFLAAINDGMECIVHQAHELISGTGARRVVATLTGSLADNLYDVTFLCANDRRDGALRLLRTPYEKYLYAHFISAHPETAEAFVHFDAIQSRALITGIEKHYGYRMSEMGRAGLEQLVKAAKSKIEWNKCKECGENLPRMWTKVTPEEMAKEADLESIHVLAYRYATLFIHPSWRGLSDQTEESIKLPSILVIVHKLVFETVRLQGAHLSHAGKLTARTGEMLTRLAEAVKL